MIRNSDPRQWAELCAAFDTLVELDTGPRAERLAAIGATNPAARRALEELLAADANSASSLDRIDGIFGDVHSVSPRSRRADGDVLKLVGQTVAHFRILEPLAAGGMGVVYRAIDTQLGRPVALKFPLPGQPLDGHARERFVREARAAAALDHSNICSIYETGETADGQLFLAMPLYDGETLKARITRAGPLPIADALAIAVQIARGLHAAHRAGIVHRDLKPANVMILSDGGVKILDFGVARTGDVTLTAPRGALGTVFYMAPEQVRGEQLDGRADLWALGVLLYEMLTGRRPFEGEHEIAVAHAIMHSKPVRPLMLRPEIWPQLDDLVLGLLAREPGNRRASAEAVVAELTALQSPSAPRKVRRWSSPLTGSARRALEWTAVLTLVVTAGVITASLRRAGAAGSSVAPRIVAVLPFEDVSGRDDTSFLAIGLADEIAARLSRLSAVAVPGEWAAVEYRGSTKPTADIAEELGARVVVRGHVGRIGDEVRLQVDLFDADEKRQVWADEYRGPVNTVLALQRQATDGIIAALDVDITRNERVVLMKDPTASAEAYDLYLRGRAAQIAALSGNVSMPQNLSQSRVESLQRAQSYHARAREIDPRFAAPRVGLAMSHLALARNDQTTARLDPARLEAEAALRLQPGMPEAHEALATYWSLRKDDLKAVDELDRAVAGRPNVAHLHYLLGISLRQLGRWEEAVNALERGSRLDPRNRSVHTQAALTYARLRRYDESIAHWDKVIAVDPADPFPQMIRGFNYLRRGDVDSLEAAISRIPLGPNSGRQTPYGHYMVHHIRRRHAEALASLDSVTLTILGDNLLYRPVSLLRAQTLERMGDTTQARSAYEAARVMLLDSVAVQPRHPGMRIALGLAYAGLHRRAGAMREARAATELAPVSADSPLATAIMGGAVEIYAQLGEVDEALELIELLFAMPAGREVSVPLLRLDPTFDPLRSDPRFDALLVRFSGN
jgi:serine/threonine protein kinase/TolB-like protein/tetratricopeptide (TPR) repeat protein